MDVPVKKTITAKTLNNMNRDDYNEQREEYQREREEEYFTRKPKDNRYDND